MLSKASTDCNMTPYSFLFFFFFLVPNTVTPRVDILVEQVASFVLLQLNRFEQCFEVPCAKALNKRYTQLNPPFPFIYDFDEQSKEK
jgi:hypothetical protein